MTNLLDYPVFWVIGAVALVCLSILLVALAQKRPALVASMMVAVIMLGGALLGGSIRSTGIYDPEDLPRRENASPPPSPLLAGVHRESAYVATSEKCRTPGHGRVAYCWYEGWYFARKTICIDSSITGAPLSAIASMFSGPGGLRVIVGGRNGACATKGYPASQRVSFHYMAKTTAARYGYGVCGLTAPANYGALQSVGIQVYVTGAQSTPCGSGAEWADVFNHEFGHALGLSHSQKSATSIMRDGHRLDTSDRANLVILYGNKRA